MAQSTILLDSISKLSDRLNSMEAKLDQLSDDLGAVRTKVELVVTSIDVVQQEHIQIAKLLKFGVPSSTTTCISDFHPNNTMVDLDAARSSAALFPPSSTTTTADKSVFFPGSAAAPLVTPDIEHNVVNIDVPANCSMKCTSSAIAVTTPTEDCSSNGGRAELSLANVELPSHVHVVAAAPKLGMRSVLLDSVTIDGLEVTKCWDPGLPDGSAFIESVGSCDSFHWDPGLLESLQSIGFIVFDPILPLELHMESKSWDPGLAYRSRFIELTGLGSVFHWAKHCWLFIWLLTQQKGSGPYILDWIVEFIHSAIPNIICLLIASSSQFITAPESIWEPGTIFAVYMDFAVFQIWQYSSLVQLTLRDIIGVTGIWKLGQLLFWQQDGLGHVGSLVFVALRVAPDVLWAFARAYVVCMKCYDLANVLDVPLLIDKSRVQTEYQFQIWQFNFFDGTMLAYVMLHVSAVLFSEFPFSGRMFSDYMLQLSQVSARALPCHVLGRDTCQIAAICDDSLMVEFYGSSATFPAQHKCYSAALPTYANYVYASVSQAIQQQENWCQFKHVIQLLQHQQLQITLYHCFMAWLLLIEYQQSYIVTWDSRLFEEVLQSDVDYKSWEKMVKFTISRSAWVLVIVHIAMSSGCACLSLPGGNSASIQLILDAVAVLKFGLKGEMLQYKSRNWIFDCELLMAAIYLFLIGLICLQPHLSTPRCPGLVQAIVISEIAEQDISLGFAEGLPHSEYAGQIKHLVFLVHEALFHLVAQPTLWSCPAKLSILVGKLGVLCFLPLWSVALQVLRETAVVEFLSPWRFQITTGVMWSVARTNMNNMTEDEGDMSIGQVVIRSTDMEKNVSIGTSLGSGWFSRRG